MSSNNRRDPNCTTAGFPGRPERLPRPWPPPPPSPSPATRPPSRIPRQRAAADVLGDRRSGQTFQSARQTTTALAERGGERGEQRRGEGERGRGRLRRRCPRGESPPLPLSPFPPLFFLPLPSPLPPRPPVAPGTFLAGAGRYGGWLEWARWGCRVAVGSGPRSMRIPRPEATSSMLGQHGRPPHSSTWLTRFEIPSRLLALTMHTTAGQPARLLPAGPTADRPPPFRRATGRGCTGPANGSPRTAGRQGSSGRLSFPQSRRDSCRRADGRRPAR